MKVTLEKLTSDVATLLGESLSLECQPEESPFPGIEDRVRILAPGLLSSLLIYPEVEVRLDGSLELSETLYHKLLMKLLDLIRM